MSDHYSDRDMEDLSAEKEPIQYNTNSVGGLDKTASRMTILGEEGGTVRTLNHQGEILLIPSPSNDPNDPLNWSQVKKWWVTCVVCAAVFCCNLSTAGPSIAILQFSADFGVLPPTGAYLLTSAALTQGISMFLWSPLIAKFGRRPIYVFSFVIYTIFVFASGACKTFGQQMACRIIMAFASGAGELLGPLTIADIFYTHERTLPIALYNAFLSVGVGLALVIDGWIAESSAGWRGIYWVSGALVAATTIAVIFTFPETAYRRGPQPSVTANQKRPIDNTQRKSYWQSLSVWPKQVYTKDSWAKLFIRNFAIVAFPAVLWTTLVFAVTIGALVSVTSNVAIAFAATYQFGSGITGSCFVSAILGSIIGVLGGSYADKWSSRLTRKNGGMREPEMRLWPIMPALITTPLALVLYGVGIQHQLHWICPTIGLGLLNFSIVWASSVSMTYMIDCLKPLAEESITAVLAYKAAFGFLLSFYTNQWIAESGYQNMFGAFAGISSFCLVLVFIFIFYGKPIRKHALEWKLVKALKWHPDRDDVVIEDE